MQKPQPTQTADLDLEYLGANISRADLRLHERLGNALTVNYDLDRRLVSYQANKTEKVARWCKYKEGFSASLVRYIIESLSIKEGRILDPFAGSGTTLFTASEFGIDSSGIELLPNAIETMTVRKSLRSMDPISLSEELIRFKDGLIWENPGPKKPFAHVMITKGAFPNETELELGRYLHEAKHAVDEGVRPGSIFRSYVRP